MTTGADRLVTLTPIVQRTCQAFALGTTAAIATLGVVEIVVLPFSAASDVGLSVFEMPAPRACRGSCSGGLRAV